LLGGEALVRITAMLAGFLAIGLAAAPAVAAVTSTAALIVMLRWLDHDLPASGMVNGSIPLRSQLAPVLVLALGLAFAIVGGPASWSSIVAVAGVVGGTGAALLWLTRPRGAKGESLLRWSRT
jgi:hypothetical protein